MIVRERKSLREFCWRRRRYCRCKSGQKKVGRKNGEEEEEEEEEGGDRYVRQGDRLSLLITEWLRREFSSAIRSVKS